MVLVRPFFLLLFMSVLIISCEKKQLRGARLAVDFPEADSLAVKIYHFPILEEEVLAQFDLDTANYGLMQLELSKPLMLYIMIEYSIEIWLPKNLRLFLLVVQRQFCLFVVT